MQKEIHRGEIWLAELIGGKGSEQKLIRPVVVMQNDIGNYYSPTVTIVPLTSQNKKWMPTHVTLHRTTCLRALSIALAEQVDTISKERFIKYIGNIGYSEILEIENALMVQLGIENKNNIAYAN